MSTDGAAGGAARPVSSSDRPPREGVVRACRFRVPRPGSYRPGFLTGWDGHPASRILDEIAERIGRDPRSLDRDPSTGERTADAQPAILAGSLVAWQALMDAGVRAEVVAGHSLGEVTAAVASGALDLGDGAALVAERGRAMGAACATTPGAMAALVKLSPDAVEVLIRRGSRPRDGERQRAGQVVVAGTPEAIERIRGRAREAGGRALPLQVEGAFHSPAMAGAVERVAAASPTCSSRTRPCRWSAGRAPSHCTPVQPSGRRWWTGSWRRSAGARSSTVWLSSAWRSSSRSGRGRAGRPGSSSRSGHAGAHRRLALGRRRGGRRPGVRRRSLTPPRARPVHERTTA
jgi:hypothetical protein